MVKNNSIKKSFFSKAKRTDENKNIKYGFLEYINMLLLLLLIICVFLQVIGRFVLKTGAFAWTEELSRLIFVAFAYLGLGIVTKYNLHFRAEIFSNKPLWLSKAQEIICHLLEIFVMLIVAKEGVSLIVLTKGDITASLQWPTAVFYAPLTIGSMIMIYYSFKKLITLFKKER